MMKGKIVAQENLSSANEGPVLVSPELEIAVDQDAGMLIDDERLIRQAFSVSAENGCEYLFRRYHAPLCSHALRFVYSREKAEDIVSDVFCKFWKNGSYDSVTTSFRFYLFRSVRNEAYTHLRSEFKEMDSIDFSQRYPVATSEQPDEVTQYEETFNRVKQLVDQLPPQCRKVFLMSRFEGKRYKTIAEELGISIKTVESHLVKGLATVRKGLGEYLVSILALLSYTC